MSASSKEIARFLKSVVIFADLETAERTHIAPLLSEVRLQRGQRLFKQGDPGETLYIVHTGTCAITVNLADGQELDIAQFENGDFFGEMSIFENEPRSAGCYARTEAMLYALTERDFHSLMDEHPQLAQKVMFRMLTATAQRLANTNVFLSDMVQWGEAARKRAVTDESTGLFNRRFLDEAIEEQFQKARTENSPISVVMLDLDHFNGINEAYGLAVGDEVITAVVPVFRHHFRESDIVARYGGDEFTILLPGTPAEEACEICTAVCRDVAELPILANRGGAISRVTTSQGVAAYPTHGATVAEVWERADAALYRAKELGRNRVTPADPVTESTLAVAGGSNGSGAASAVVRCSPPPPQEAKCDIESLARKNRIVTNVINAFVTRRSFLIVGHENPDEDCVASMVAIGLLLSKLSKPVVLCTAAEIPGHFRYLLEICRFNSIAVNSSPDAIEVPIDTLIICDTAKPSMVELGPASPNVLNDPEVLKIEIDHHLDTDSRYSGDPEHCLVASASSAAELVGYIGCKLSARRDIIQQYDIEEVFTRNMVLAILTGIVGDTQMGKFIKTRKERRFYNIFSGMFNRLLSQKTTKQTNFYNMEQVYAELRSLSATQEELYTELLERHRRSNSIAYVALDARDSQGVYSRFDIDTVVSVARATADELAEISGKLSLVAYYDHVNLSDLVQFRMRRSHQFRGFDLRALLTDLKLTNGGGHKGAIGFRLPKAQIEDFDGYISYLIDTAEAKLAASQSQLKLD